MARPVQLAPESLALVLSRLEAPAAAGGAEEPGGHAVFRAFRRANARCFWDARLARAASRLAFQGWLRRAVLLVRAPAACLQVLRAAWARRALRPPRGFRIRALGECGAPGPPGRVHTAQLRGAGAGAGGRGRRRQAGGWKGALSRASPPPGAPMLRSQPPGHTGPLREPPRAQTFQPEERAGPRPPKEASA